MVYDLELVNVGKVYDNGTPAVIDFNLAVTKGEFIAFLGPSGCGKTTTLRMIAGFEAISSGDVMIRGGRINDLPPEKRPTSMIFQNYALFPHMSVRRNVGYGLEVKGLAKAQRDAKVDRILATLGLEDIADKRPDKLSGGQRQRIALARGLVVEPDILLLDEPLGALDANLRKAIQSELKLLQKTLGITFVFVTHAQSEALSLSDHIVLMNQGRIVQIDGPETLYAAPRTLFAARFLGDANLIPATRSSADTVTLASGQPLPVARSEAGAGTGSAVTVLVRPEAIRLAPEGNPTEGVGRLGGVVTDVVYCGKRILYTVAADAGYTLIAEENSSGTPSRPEVGSRVEASWAAAAGVVISEGLPH